MYKRILLAIDLNEAEGSVRAAKAALTLAGQEGAELHVINVVPDSGMAIVDAALGPNHTRQIIEHASAALTEFARANLPGVADDALHVVQGTIYDRIIHTADAIGADAIVVGSHRPELKDYLVGPNAARVVRHSHQSVLVVR